MIKISWTQPSGELIKIPEELKTKLAIVRGQGQEIRITVEPVYKQRTENQNALFHARINELSKECGANREWLKDEIKMIATDMGYPYEIYDGRKVPKSTKEATVEEMEILIEAIYDYAFDNGINIRS